MALFLALSRLFRPILFLAFLSLLVGCGSNNVGTGNWPGISADGSRVYVAYGQQVVAVDVAQKKTVWQYPEKPSASLQFFAPPLITQDRVYLADYGKGQGFFSPGVRSSLYALASDNTALVPTPLWEKQISTDRIVAAALEAEGKLFVGTADNFLVALNEGDGTELWRTELDHSVWAQASYVDGKVIVASLNRSLYAFAAENGTPLWQTEVGGAITSKPIIVNDTVYVANFDANLYAVDVNTGKIRWQAPSADSQWSAPTIVNDVAYLGDVQGNFYALDAQTGDTLWQTKVEGAVQNTPLWYNDVLYIPIVVGLTSEGQTGGIVAISADGGEPLWQYNIDHGIYTPPLLANDQIVVVYQRNAQSAELIVLDPIAGNIVWNTGFTP